MRTVLFTLSLLFSFLLLACGGGSSAAPAPAPVQPPTALTYSTPTAAYTKGVAITANTPSSSGGAVVSYAVSPALPAGLSLSTTTGIITGTPTAVTALATYTVTATNPGGSTTAALSITVNDAAPANLTYATNPVVYTRNVAITPNAPSSTGGAVVSYAVSPALPAGLSLSTTTGIITGTPTAVTALATYTVTATNPGGSTTAALGITVNSATVAPANLTYATNPAVYTKGVAITANTPSSGGGAVVSYAVSPALPAGLSLSTTTGIITGTPTAVTALATYTVTATNPGGSTTAAQSITVNDAAPANLTYSSNPAVYIQGTAITPNTPSNSGGTVVSYAVLPSLPGGLSLDTTTGIISGTPTAANALASYVVTATNTGGSTTATLAITVNGSGVAYPRYAYTANATDNSVSTYVVDSASGRLKYIGRTAAGTTPQYVTVDPAGKYAYVLNSGDNTVSQYSIGSNGALTAMTPATVATDLNPVMVAVDPTGRYVYVVNESLSNIVPSTISQYAIGSNGALTALTPATIAVGPVGSVAIAFDPAGKYAYVVDSNSFISQFTIGSNGVLTAMSTPTVATGLGPTSIAVDASGRYAYVTNSGISLNTSSVSQYTIAANGSLVPMSVPTVATGLFPVFITLDPSGKYAYVADAGSSTVSQFSIAANGSLVAMNVSTIATPGTPQYVKVDPSGKYAYVMFYGGVLQYVLAGDGSLSPITPAVAAAPHGIAATTVAISQGSSPVVAVPQYAYVANNGDSTVSQYTIDANGGLAAMANPTVATGAHPAAVTVDPSGRYAYVVNFSDNTLSQYTIGADGSLAPMTPATVATDVTPVAIVIDPSGTYAYVANAGAYNANTNSYAPTVSQYSISSSGALQPLSPALFTWGSGDGLNAIAVDPSGQNVYVVSSHSLWQFTRNGFNAAATVPFTATGSLAPTISSPSPLNQGIDFTFDPSGRFAYAQDVLLEQYTVGGTGTLTAIATQTAIGGGASVVVDPFGKYVYAADGATQLSQYSMGSDGALTSLTPANVADANRPWAMVVDPSGNYAYVANIGNNTVSQYTIGSGGALTAMSTPAVPAGTLNFNHPGKIIALCGTWH